MAIASPHVPPNPIIHQHHQHHQHQHQNPISPNNPTTKPRFFKPSSWLIRRRSFKQHSLDHLPPPPPPPVKQIKHETTPIPTPSNHTIILDPPKHSEKLKRIWTWPSRKRRETVRLSLPTLSLQDNNNNNNKNQHPYMDDLHRPRIRFTATDAYPSPPSSPPLMPTVPPPSPVITKDLWRTPSVTTSGDERRVRWRSDEEGRLPLVVGATRVRRCVSVSIGATGVRDGAEVVGRQRKDGEEVLVRHATAPPRIVTPKKRNVPSEKKRDIVGDVLLSRDKEEEEEMIKRRRMRWWCGMAVVVSMGVMVWNMGVYVVMLFAMVMKELDDGH